MWSLITSLLAKLALLKLVIKTLGSLGLLLPIAFVLKAIGMPILVVLAILAAPIFIVLAIIGLPFMFVIVVAVAGSVVRGPFCLPAGARLSMVQTGGGELAAVATAVAP